MRKWNINNLAEQTKFCQSMLPRKLKVMNRLSNFLLIITIFKTNIFKPNYLKWFRKKIAKTGPNNEDSLDAIPKWIDFFNCYNNLSRQLNVQGQFAQLKEELSVWKRATLFEFYLYRKLFGCNPCCMVYRLKRLTYHLTCFLYREPQIRGYFFKFNVSLKIKISFTESRPYLTLSAISVIKMSCWGQAAEIFLF